MRAIQKILVVFIVLSQAALIHAADWPNFRGSACDGFSPEKLPNKDWKAKPPKELWRITLGDAGYAGPSVAGGKLFIIDHADNRDVVRAIDIKSGKNVWTQDYADTDKNQYGFAHTTPTVDAGRVYTLSREGRLHCWKADDGALVWKRDLKTEYGGRWKGDNWGYASSPLVDGDALIVCPSGPDALVAALDKNTGKEIWKGGGDDAIGYATPLKAEIAGKTQYVIFSGLNVLGLDVKNGATLWTTPWHTAYGVNAATPLVVGNQVFVSSNYGVGCELLDCAVVPPKELWRNKALKAHFSSPIFHDGHIYGTGEPDDLSCIALATGDVKWKQKGFQKGGIIGIDGMIIAMGGSDGDVVLCKLSPDGYAESGRIKPLGGQSWTAPIVSGGKLYVRNATALVCLELNPEK